MSEPYDSGDLDALLEMERSRGYELLVARIGDELERQRLNLEMWVDPETLRAQGQVKALRTVLSLTEILKSEIKASLDKE